MCVCVSACVCVCARGCACVRMCVRACVRVIVCDILGKLRQNNSSIVNRNSVCVCVCVCVHASVFVCSLTQTFSERTVTALSYVMPILIAVSVAGGINGSVLSMSRCVNPCTVYMPAGNLVSINGTNKLFCNCKETNLSYLEYQTSLRYFMSTTVPASAHR